MAQIANESWITAGVSFTVDAAEAKMLLALAHLGDETILQLLYDKLDQPAMQKHAPAVRRFLGSIRSNLPEVLAQIDNAQKALRTRICVDLE